MGCCQDDDDGQFISVGEVIAVIGILTLMGLGTWKILELIGVFNG